MNTERIQSAASKQEVMSARSTRRRFLPYLSAFFLMLLCVAVVVTLDVLPSLETVHSKVAAQEKPQDQAQDQLQEQGQEPPSMEGTAAPLLTLTADDVPLLTSLQERQTRLEALEQKERQLAEREEALQLAQQQIETQLETLQTLRQEIEDLIVQKEIFEEQRFEHLVKVYEGMRPAEAAALVERLQEDTAVQLFVRMKGKKVGKILAAIKPEVAAKLSERLATLQQKNAGEGAKEQAP